MRRPARSPASLGLRSASRAITALVLVSTTIPPGGAAAASGPAAPPLRPVTARVHPDLATFRARHGAGFLAVDDPVTRRPSFYFGASFPAPASASALGVDPVARARAVLAADADLLGIDDSELVAPRVAELALDRFGSSDKVAVRFRQEALGVECFDATVAVLFDARTGDVIGVDTTAVRDATVAVRPPDVTAEAAAATARGAALARLGRAGEVVDVSPVVAGPRPLFGEKHPLTDRGATLCWRVTLRDERPGPDGLPGAARALVAAHGAPEILWLEDQVHRAINGKVEARLNQDLDPFTPANLETVPLGFLDIRQGGPGGPVVATSAADGTFSVPGNGPVTLFAELRGPYVEVTPAQGSPLSLTLVADAQTPANFLFNAAPSPAEFDTAQVQEAFFPERFRQFVKSVDPQDATMDRRIATLVNVAAACNAVFFGEVIWFFASGGGCPNTAYATVSHHEHGHWANQEYNDVLSGALNEGLADAWAYYVEDTPCLGPDFFGPGSGCLRIGTNLVTFCGNGNDNCWGEIHASGNVIGGAFWLLRQSLGGALGAAAGKDYSSALLIGWLRAFNDSTISTTIRDHLVALDDDDANLLNGTPNLAAIDAAFQAKGFPAFAPPDLELLAVGGPQDGVAVPSQHAPTFSVQVVAKATSVASVTLHHSTDDGQNYATFPLASQGGDLFSGPGPALVAPATARWYVTVAAAGGDVETWPPHAPDGDFALYHVGAVTPFAWFDFDTPDGQELGWTHAQLAGAPAPDADDWARKAPEGAAPSDPDAAYSGTRCQGTDLGQIVGGAPLDGRYRPDVSTELRSPLLDLSAAPNARLQFRRWLAVEDGGYDQAEIYANGQKIWANPGTPGGGDHHTADFGWVQQDFDITALAAGQPAVQIAFRITSDAGLQFGGWQIDDLRVVSVGPGQGSFAAYGAGCPGAGSLVPTLAGVGTPAPGAGVGVGIGSGAPNALALLFLATAKGQAPVQGCSFLLAGAVLPPIALPLDGAGAITVTTAVPISAPPGATVDMQAIVLDPGAPNQAFSASNGLEMKL